MSLQAFPTLRSPSYANQGFGQPVFELAQVAPRAPAETPTHPQNGQRGTWFYDVIENEQHAQTVVQLAKMEDWQARIIFNRGTTAFQPAGVMVKMTLMDIASKKMRVLDNVSVRFDSHLKSTVESVLQSGVDLTKESIAKQLEYAKAGEPIMDMATIRSGADAEAGSRIEASAKFQSAPRVKAVMRTALKAGASVGKTMMWLDPKTLVRTRLDITLVAKGEAAAESGFSTKLEPFSLRAEAELQIRISRSDMQQVSAKTVFMYTELASRWLADFFSSGDAQKSPQINTINRGATDAARYNITQKLVSGTPVWHLLPHTGGKNHGHPVIDLALRVTGLLRSRQSLRSDGYATSLSQASGLLTALWGKLTPGEKAQLAPKLANRLNINFGLPEVAWLNAREFSRLPMTPKERGYRALFR